MKIIKFEGTEIEEFNTIEELFNIEWIKEWSNNDLFLKYSRANKRLLAEWKEFNEKQKRYVRQYKIIGRFLGTCDLDIPVFE